MLPVQAKRTGRSEKGDRTEILETKCMTTK